MNKTHVLSFVFRVPLGLADEVRHHPAVNIGCLRHRNATAHQNGQTDADKSARRRGRFSRSSTRRIAAANGARPTGSDASKGDGRQKESQEGSSDRRPGGSKRSPGLDDGRLTLAETKDGEEPPIISPKVNPHGIGDPACCPGEALLWQQSESPDGLTKRKCAGDSLVG